MAGTFTPSETIDPGLSRDLVTNWLGLNWPLNQVIGLRAKTVGIATQYP